MSLVRAGAAAMAVAFALGGCTYDYLQHSDRVAYSAGDAVKANLERETINPSKKSQFNTRGLGRDGVVLAVEEEPASPEQE